MAKQTIPPSIKRALAVACPTCNAPVDEPCARSVTTGGPDAHPKRVALGLKVFRGQAPAELAPPRRRYVLSGTPAEPHDTTLEPDGAYRDCRSCNMGELLDVGDTCSTCGRQRITRTVVTPPACSSCGELHHGWNQALREKARDLAEAERIGAVAGGTVRRLMAGRFEEYNAGDHPGHVALVEPYDPPGIVEHEWKEIDGHPACVRCGVVRRADGKNKPCRGKLPSITVRTGIAMDPGSPAGDHASVLKIRTGPTSGETDGGTVLPVVSIARSTVERAGSIAHEHKLAVSADLSRYEVPAGPRAPLEPGAWAVMSDAAAAQLPLRLVHVVSGPEFDRDTDGRCVEEFWQVVPGGRVTRWSLTRVWPRDATAEACATARAVLAGKRIVELDAVLLRISRFAALGDGHEWACQQQRTAMRADGSETDETARAIKARQIVCAELRSAARDLREAAEARLRFVHKAIPAALANLYTVGGLSLAALRRGEPLAEWPAELGPRRTR